jgi:hypothetical protein
VDGTTSHLSMTSAADDIIVESSQEHHQPPPNQQQQQQKEAVCNLCCKFLCILYILYLGGNVVLIIWNPAIGLIVLASVIVILMVCVACGDSHNVRPHQLPQHHGYSNNENGGIADGLAAVGDGFAAVGGVVASFGDSGGGGGGCGGCGGGG